MCTGACSFVPSSSRAVQYAGFTVMPVLGGLFSYLLGSEEIPLVGRFLMLTQFTAPAFFVAAMSSAVFLLLYFIFQDGESFSHDRERAGRVRSPAVSWFRFELAHAAVSCFLVRNDSYQVFICRSCFERSKHYYVESAPWQLRHVDVDPP